MKHLFAAAALATVAFLGFTQDSRANGGLFRRCRGGDSGCASAPCAPAAPVEAKWEERKVTRYKPVMQEKVIDVLECKRVTREEKYTYTVCVPVEKMEKRMVTICTPVTREVDVVYTVMVPKCVEKKVQVCNFRCEREIITEKVPVCRTVCVTYVDECGRCCTKREHVTEMVERQRCVVKRIPVMEERIVKVTICEAVQQKGKKTICEIQRTQKEEMVKVCSIERKPMEGVRTVCEIKTEKVQRKVQVCVMERYEETSKVQVGGCAPACESGHGGRGGFFRRGGCCN